jgi:large subunit ribosomal protein L35
MIKGDELNMPKLKTVKGAKKRVKLSKSGKVKRRKACGRHILTKKSRKRKRSLRSGAMVDKTFEKKIRSLLPYA